MGGGGVGESGTAGLGQTLSGALGRRGGRPARGETAQRQSTTRVSEKLGLHGTRRTRGYCDKNMSIQCFNALCSNIDSKQ